jgi:hypothetical protein
MAVNGIQTHGEKQLHSARSSRVSRFSLPSLVHETLNSQGQPLAADVRAFFEHHFCRDLRQVRVHTDARAVASAETMGTLAYAVGNHVVFGEGRFAPWTPVGRQLLAHELTHVLQQNQTEPFAIDRVTIGETRDVFEQEADACARMISEDSSASDRRPHIKCKTLGPVFQGWWIANDAPSSVHGQTHELITQTILKEAKYKLVFRLQCFNMLLRGVAEPDIEKKTLEAKHGKSYVASRFHGWGASVEQIDKHIASYAKNAADLLNTSTNNLDRSLRIELGRALHAAQDKAAHQSPVPAKTTSDGQDDPAINIVGWRRAFDYTRIVLDGFINMLNAKSLLYLKTGLWLS